MNLNWLSAFCCVAVAGAAGPSTPPDAAGDRMIETSHAVVAALPSFQIKQTMDQRAVLVVNGKPMGSENGSKQTSTIEVDTVHGLARMTAKNPDGWDLVAIRSGRNIALKLGSQP